MLTRLCDGIVKPKLFLSTNHPLPISPGPVEPTTVSPALVVPAWKKAMQAEYTALMYNQTWELVPIS
ncbi:hypothetical protein L484_016382 [Morus notabilis]|uniref:Uncharacterized protein n=1 Tax=Morus notabilis TaxID=981085 RepID=W9RYS2_9ROSA|nr:hypothetical protein L484_016382 [Morus notabilis]